jgi:hypothetical protein
MNQILAVEDWHARIILERAVYQIEVIACTTHGWVGVKAREYRIAESLTPSTQCKQQQGCCQ